MNSTLVRPVIAEFVGTALFVFLGAGSVVSTAANPSSANLIVALTHGVALAVIVSATMNISGAHLNPAVTLGLFAIKRVDGRTMGSYLVAQLAGAVLAAAMVKWLFPVHAARAVNLGTPAVAAQVTFLQAVALEAVLTMVLMSAVLGTIVSRDAPKIGGFGVGLAVLAAGLADGPLTGAALNPARAFGPALVSMEFHAQAIYWIGPIVGAALAAVLWHLVLLPKEKN